MYVCVSGIHFASASSICLCRLCNCSHTAIFLVVFHFIDQELSNVIKMKNKIYHTVGTVPKFN